MSCLGEERKEKKEKEKKERKRKRKMDMLIIPFLVLLLFVNHVISLRCYVCGWTAAYCQDFNCYNNPDVCTNNNFSPTIVKSVECPAGCESFTMTDPNGLVQQWRRNCETSGETAGKKIDPKNKCATSYQLGLRITRCSCNDHLCNFGNVKQRPLTLIIMGMALFTSILYFYP